MILKYNFPAEQNADRKGNNDGKPKIFFQLKELQTSSQLFFYNTTAQNKYPNGIRYGLLLALKKI